MLLDTNHLQEIVLKSENLESFQNNWTMVMSELKKQPYPDILQHLYYRQVQCFKPLAEDMSHYRRAKGSKAFATDHSFEFLWEASSRYLLIKRGDLMQAALRRGLTRGSRQGHPSH